MPNHKKITFLMLMTIQKILINQKIANRLYDCLGDHSLVIDYQSRVNQEKKHEDNIINKDEVVFTDENGNYIQ